MYWDEAPYSQYQATFDQNSRPRINLTGTVATDKSYKQKIPYKISTELLYNIHSEIQLGVSSFSTHSQVYGKCTFYGNLTHCN